MENSKEVYEKALELYNSKNYIEAVQLWKSVEEESNSEVLYMLGICYNYNLGVNEEDEEKQRFKTV